MTNQGKTEINILIDRSGSMSQIRDDAEKGIRSFLEDQAKEPGECFVTLAQFDTEFDVVNAGIPIGEVPEYKLVPRGWTALYDSWARLIHTVGDRLSAQSENDRPGTVYFIVVTDGLENSSEETTSDDLRELVTQQTEQYAWRFVYLGANQNAILEARKVGVAAASSMTYDATHKTGETYSVLSASVSRSRGAGGQSIDFLEEERKRVQ